MTQPTHGNPTHGNPTPCDLCGRLNPPGIACGGLCVVVRGLKARLEALERTAVRADPDVIAYTRGGEEVRRAGFRAAPGIPSVERIRALVEEFQGMQVPLMDEQDERRALLANRTLVLARETIAAIESCAAGPWIPVGSELPPDYETVLVWQDFCDGIGDWCGAERDQGEWYEPNGRGPGAVIHNVTHWTRVRPPEER